MASTTTAAELLGVAEDRGAVEVGKRADLVVARGDGSSVEGLRERITHVFQDGHRVAGGTAS